MQVGSPLGSHQVVTRPSAPRRAAHWAVSLLVAGGSYPRASFLRLSGLAITCMDVGLRCRTASCLCHPVVRSL